MSRVEQDDSLKQDRLKQASTHQRSTKQKSPNQKSTKQKSTRHKSAKQQNSAQQKTAVPKKLNPAARSRQAGLSLVELLLALAIMAILSALAYPSVSDYLLKNHRVAAQQSLYGLQLQQEEWRIHHAQYAPHLSDLNSSLATHPHYSFSISQASGSQYQLTATAKPSSAQAQDRQGRQSCQTLTLSRNHEKTPVECWE